MIKNPLPGDPKNVDLEVGDQFWWVAGYRRHLLAIKVTVTMVEDWARKNHPGAYLFYTVDEPVGHGLACHDMLTREEAERELLDRWEDWHQAAQEDDRVISPEALNEARAANLEDFRKTNQDAIAATWDGDHPGFDPYPPKERGKDWFNIEDALKVQNEKKT